MEVAYLNTTCKNIEKKIEEIFQILDYRPLKDFILIKPNLVVPSSPDSNITTSPKIIEAIVKFLINHYPEKKILIGDGPAVRSSFEDLIKSTGLHYLNKLYNVEFVNLNDTEMKEVKWKYGILKLPKLLDNHEYINVPKLKTHVQTTVSICVKNQKGLLDISTKKKFHRINNLNGYINELSKIIKPDINIIDAIYSIEGCGPVWQGKIRKTNCIIASKNIHAADNLAVKFIGFDIDKIDHIDNVIDFSILGDKFSSLKKKFKEPVLPIKDLNMLGYVNNTACSQCTLQVYKALHPKNVNFSYLLKMINSGLLFKTLNFIFGKYDVELINKENILCYGNCTEAYSKKYSHPFIKGCPPSIEETREKILNIAKNKFKNNE